MKRSDYENNKWYPLTENEYWVEEFPEEFPNCHTVVYNNKEPYTYRRLVETINLYRR